MSRCAPGPCCRLAGYGPCLAATFALHKAKLLPEDTPGKIGGPPGNAFELVYTSVTDAVRKRMHASDPVLGEWIRQASRRHFPKQCSQVCMHPSAAPLISHHRLHLYGDVYSSPGLDLRQKQLLMCACLAEHNMHEQLFGHALAVSACACMWAASPHPRCLPFPSLDPTLLCSTPSPLPLPPTPSLSAM